MRKSITQKDPMGCGAACVAFVTNQHYRAVIEKLGPEKAQSSGFYLKDLNLVLSGLGLSCEGKYVKPRIKTQIYTEGAIVFIKRSSRYPEGHYLVRHNKHWMDPWINFGSTKNIAEAESGFRKRLPGKAQWALIPTN